MYWIASISLKNYETPIFESLTPFSYLGYYSIYLIWSPPHILLENFQGILKGVTVFPLLSWWNDLFKTLVNGTCISYLYYRFNHFCLSLFWQSPAWFVWALLIYVWDCFDGYCNLFKLAFRHLWQWEPVVSGKFLKKFAKCKSRIKFSAFDNGGFAVLCFRFLAVLLLWFGRDSGWFLPPSVNESI